MAGAGLNYGMTQYTRTRFAPNTWINGIYCTGKTVDEVNAELLKALHAPVITVRDSQGGTYSIDLAQVDFAYDYSSYLKSCQQVYSGKYWIKALSAKRDLIAEQPVFTYNEQKLESIWSSLPIVEAEKIAPVVSLSLEEEGYTFSTTLDGHLDVKKGLEVLVNAVNSGETNLSLSDADCYFDYEMTADQQKIYAKWQELREKEVCGLTYDMGAEKVVFDRGLMSKFIAKDDAGNPLYDEEGNLYYDKEIVDQYMTDLCESYHTYGVMRDFLSSKGDVIQVEGVTYGTEINTKKEVEYLWSYLSDNELRLQETVHTPEYIKDTPIHGLDDIGGTYVEVDMTDQKLYYYIDYELQFSTDIVTGNLRTRHDTPAGVNYIYAKQKNRVLRGPGYASFVKYWMPVIKAIGLHDASWRSEFGGEIYKTSGSHGCVNIPEEYVAQIYETAEIGTPVIMFY